MSEQTSNAAAIVLDCIARSRVVSRISDWGWTWPPSLRPQGRRRRTDVSPSGVSREKPEPWVRLSAIPCHQRVVSTGPQHTHCFGNGLGRVLDEHQTVEHGTVHLRTGACAFGSDGDHLGGNIRAPAKEATSSLPT